MASAQEVHGVDQGELRSRRNGAGKFGWSDNVLLAPVFDADGSPRLVFAIEDPINHLRPTDVERELVRLLVEHADAALERVTFRNRLEHLVDHDASTGLLNRRALARIPRESPATATLMVCDLDHFKNVNDTYGHEVGDAVILLFADLLRSLSREHDLAVRLGGDEFIVFLPETTLQQARLVAERLRTALTPLMLQLVSSEITVSIGLTQMEAGEQLVDAMRRADSALYAAKNNGRNQIAFD
jgi:diguanylate cyclase (GGDEF)-like protein